jgi:hypothetical protein
VNFVPFCGQKSIVSHEEAQKDAKNRRQLVTSGG